MSEPRFTIQKASGMYIHLPIFDNGVEMADGDVCILLNEQQATNSALRTENNHLIDVIKEYAKKYEEQQDTIKKLQDLCGKSDGENAKLRIENKRLEKEVNLLRPTNLEQYEQIQKLQEENEQLRENLHNCRLNKNIISEKLKLWQDVHKEYNIYSIKDFEELLNGLKKENEKLRKELGDCEKFRYTVFKRLNDEYIKERSIK